MVQKNSKIIFFFGIIIVIIIAIIVTLNLTKKNSSPISFNRKKWMEKKAIEFLFDYYSKLGNDYFNVNAYYAPLVRKYYLKDSLTTDEISDLYYDSYLPEYHDPVYIVDSNSIKIYHASNEILLKYSGTFTCYRKSKRRYQYARNKVVMVLNDELKILEIYEEKVTDVLFTRNPIPIY